MTLYPKGPKGKADRLFSLVVRARGECAACHATEDLQCAHIRSRRFSWTRTLEANAVCLCRSCHMRFTHDPLLWVRWVDGRIGARAHDELRARSLSDEKLPAGFWEDECARLSRLLGKVT